MDRNDSSWKLMAAVFFVLLVWSVILLSKEIKLKVTQRDIWVAKSDSLIRQDDMRMLLPSRGNILSENGELLSASVPYYRPAIDFSVEPLRENNGKMFRDGVDSLAIGLNKVLGEKSIKEYRKMLWRGYNRKLKCLQLTRKPVKYTIYKRLSELPILRNGRYKGGFYPSEKLVKRIKPFGTLAAITIGNLNDEGRATNGVEHALDKELRGEIGEGKIERRAGANIIVERKKPEPGADVVTTLDVEIQDICEKALRRELEELQAEAGVAMVMEVKTGKIKAIVNLNGAKKTKDEDIMTYHENKSIALTSNMEPGSTFKVPAMMAALEDGTVKHGDSVDCGDGMWYLFGVNKDPISDFNTGDKGNGKIPIEQAIVRSSNVGMGKIMYDRYPNVRKAQHWVDVLKKMGVDRHIDLGFTGVAEAKISGPREKGKKWNHTDVASMAYGYSVNMPLLYTLNFYNAIANNGIMMAPYIIKEVRRNGEIIKETRPRVMQEKICKDEVLEQIKAMMLDVVEDKHGTAKPVRSEYVKIAGKTGTARYGYGTGNGWKHHVSFCGFFPYEKPRYSCIVFIKNPKNGSASGGKMAGVVFKEIAERVMAKVEYMPVAAFNSVEMAKERRILGVKNDSCGEAYVRRLTPCPWRGRKKDAESIYKELELEMFKADTKEINEDDYVTIRYDKNNNGELRAVMTKNNDKGLNNLIGMGLRDAIYAIESEGLKAKVVTISSDGDTPKGGRRKVIGQSPEEGARLSKGGVVTIEVRE